MPVDYSKFDSIEDSDEEREKETKVTKTAEKKAEAPKDLVCANCGRAAEKLSKCSVCKKVGYCSVRCQHSDWQFHKRTCKKPPAAKGDAKRDDAPSKPKPARPPRKAAVAESSDDDDDDAPITWYKHRETKLPPSAAGPSKVEPAAAPRPVAAAEPERRASQGSVWNTAGTWEEKDVLGWARTWLEASLPGLSRDLPRPAKPAVRSKLSNSSPPTGDFGTGVLRVTAVAKVEGDASVGVIRGRTRHIFDLELEVRWEARLGGDETKYKGKLKFADVTHDLGGDDADAIPCQCLFTDEKKAGAGAARIKQHALGPKAAVDPARLGATLADDVVAELKAKFLPAFGAL